MSTRWYPLYRKGFPQRRVFMPNTWMKLVKLEHLVMPKNVVHFECSPEMTDHDVKNYLEKIYNVPVMNVKTWINSGKTHDHKYYQFLYKDDDYKMARVTLPKDAHFEFPDVVKMSEREKVEKKSSAEIRETKKKFLEATKKKEKGRDGLPSFFGL